MAVFIPTLAWGKAEPHPAEPAAGFSAHTNYFQDISGSDPSDNSVTVPAGSTVSFSFATNDNVHNAKFREAPTSCTTISGPASSPTAVPASPLPGPWLGECKFDVPGTYTFFCEAHQGVMEGSVVVESAGTPTATATQTPTATVTPAPTETATATASATAPAVVASTPPPVAPPASTPAPVEPKLDKPASLKRTVFLKRGLKVSGRCAAGGAGKVALTVSKASAKKLKLKGTTLAKGTAKCDGSGRMTATLKPSAAAKKALKRQRKALTATATLTVDGATAKASVKLK